MPNSEESRHSSHKTTMQHPVKAWTGQPYPAYKDSGLHWLGNIPVHWQVRRGKTLMTSIDIRSATGKEELLTVSAQHGVIPRETANVTMFKAESYVGYKLCWPGDLVINSLWAWAYGLGVSQNYGIISSAYGVYRAHSILDTRFFHLLVRSAAFQWELQIRSKGIWKSRLQLTDESFMDASMPVPPLPEQHAIAHFLDHTNQRIQRHIHAKEKLIKLLEEQKQVIIHQAVTGQIDVRTGQPYPAYKESGVEWLGKVPEHWEVFRLRRFVSLTVGFPFKSEGFTQADGDIRLLRGVNIVPGGLRWHEVVRWPVEDMDNFAEYQMQVGDIVVGMDRPIIQSGTRVAVVSSSDVPSLLLQRVARIRVRDGLVRDFAVAFLSGKGFADYLAPIFTGISVPHLSSDQINSFQFSIPSVSEQKSIIKHMAAKIGTIESTITSATRQIQLLHEYRTRLIADVVTGKLDVREAAAELPGHGPSTTDNACQDGMAFAAQVRSRHP